MTTLRKPIARQTAAADRGRPLIVTLYPRHLEIRAKGLRTRYSISIEACYWLAIKRHADEEREAKRRK
jgi:hypothetical protein